MKFLGILAVWLFSRSFAEPVMEVGPLEREKRFIIFPPTSPTRHQFIFGIGIPLDLDSIAVTTGYVFKAQYFLPTKPEQLRISPIWETKKVRRDIPSASNYSQSEMEFDGHREVYNVDNVLIEESPIAVDEEDYEWMKEDEDELQEVEKTFETDDDFTVDHTRWHIYRGLEAIANEHGFGGRACVLRLICEAAEVPLDQKSGILSELVHILLTPSTTNEKVSQHSDNEYFRAEQLGQSGVSCSREFGECKGSLLDIISSVHDPMVDEIVKIMT
ncbi:uncharacterized protein LOC129790177 [Lutzomyia longipalpis]|uniref:uncharacterized protein LOC129790177 n=1 Tax=Lutzomyia longipalpis TaxID=7200 RepID=UPI002483572F|nr:uncharacterized protein LOC129790177 [Lutzomyia longipalpis]